MLCTAVTRPVFKFRVSRPRSVPSPTYNRGIPCGAAEAGDLSVEVHLTPAGGRADSVTAPGDIVRDRETVGGVEVRTHVRILPEHLYRCRDVFGLLGEPGI